MKKRDSNIIFFTQKMDNEIDLNLDRRLIAMIEIHNILFPDFNFFLFGIKPLSILFQHLD